MSECDATYSYLKTVGVENSKTIKQRINPDVNVLLMVTLLSSAIWARLWTRVYICNNCNHVTLATFDHLNVSYNKKTLGSLSVT